MEGISVSAYKGLKGCWRRKGYQRLNGSKQRCRRNNSVEGLERTTASSNRPRRRFTWRIKITRPKLRFFGVNYSLNVREVFKRFRDAYVRLMVSFAKSRVFINGFGGGGSGSSVGYGLGKPHQYDEKTMVEIYKSMIAQGQLAVTSHNSVVML
ncbi:hypothetical protein MKX01_007675 [Papaver californicum]|nr:hypothetical protein MKX01_007675 [Papaver californicum]